MTALVRIDRLTAGYDGSPAVTGVSLEIGPGAFTGVVGPSGSGKTTLLRCILGSLRPLAGSVRRTPGLRVAYVPQVETVNWNFPVTVGEVVQMARTGGRRGGIRPRLPRPPWSSASERAQVSSVLERLGIGRLAGRHIRELSGGQQQRVFLARALVSDPQLVLLDEPTGGVDVRTRHDVLHLLAELNKGGMAIVLTTHDLNGIAAHLPHLVCLNREVIGEGSPRQVLTAEVLERTYGAPMEVLEHGGMPVVVDPFPPASNVVGLRRRA